jgi:hypothetical protein
MAIEMLSYRQLGERLGCSRDAARELVKRLRLPRHMANDGKALICIDLSEINHNPAPTQSPAGPLPETVSQECIEPKQAGRRRQLCYQAALERERERAERLMAELLRAKADILAARGTVARLEGELAALRLRPWWRRLCRRKRQPSNFAVPQTVFASNAAA